jgi:hypothetical protein
VTGRDCPACGITRSIGALTQGELMQAADHNLLVVIAAIGVGLVAITSLVSTSVRSSLMAWLRNPPTSAVWSSVVVIVAFTVVRNSAIPLGQWLHSGVYAL